MSNINLLPWRESAKERQKQGFFVLLGVCATFAVASVFAVNQYFTHRIDIQTQRNQFMQNEIAMLDSQIGQINQIKLQKNALVNRMKLIDALQQSRNISVRLFNELPRVIANGVYLQSLNYDQSQIDVVGKAEAYNRVANTMRLIESTKWLGLATINSIFTNDNASMKLSEFSMRFHVLSSDVLKNTKTK
jgi:type IV pilus assembly protein PilN